MALPFLPSPRFPKELLLQVLRIASGVQVEWTTAKRPMLGLLEGAENAWLLVRTTSMGNEGTDELRRQYDPVADANDELQGGQRSCTLHLRAISLDETLEAYDLLARVRFQLRTDKCHNLMIGTLALHEFHPIVPLADDTVEDRLVLVAELDVRMGYVDQSDPLDPSEGGYADATDAANHGTLTP